MTNSTTAATIENLPKNQTIFLQTPEATHTMLAKPLFGFLHQHFPNASFEALDTILKGNAAYGLHLAKQHNLAALEIVPAPEMPKAPVVPKGAFIASMLYPQTH